ncbi:hypothetical protein RSOLAG1IB_12182 [Rhizoctonia solani AG-1 IB]|uniref:Uncharacterized protein n=1 Tax=Thanatephorus cucumeris (strain AG1-IB / isolate 7/3/14) TaxID=1108050 RepID=A0A0B7FRC4_THACB|nr:hypothetical protein RSOLAG1IB_12182 [Rhizoctonia solani AG-1 IB]
MSKVFPDDKLLKDQSPGTLYVILTHVFTYVRMYAYKCVLYRFSCTSVHYHTVELRYKSSSSTCLSTQTPPSVPRERMNLRRKNQGVIRLDGYKKCRAKIVPS